jgi:hypothetical protein
MPHHQDGQAGADGFQRSFTPSALEHTSTANRANVGQEPTPNGRPSMAALALPCAAWPRWNGVSRLRPSDKRESLSSATSDFHPA